jgi:hypothetical protein
MRKPRNKQRLTQTTSRRYSKICNAKDGIGEILLILLSLLALVALVAEHL